METRRERIVRENPNASVSQWDKIDRDEGKKIISSLYEENKVPTREEIKNALVLRYGDGIDWDEGGVYGHDFTITYTDAPWRITRSGFDFQTPMRESITFQGRFQIE